MGPKMHEVVDVKAILATTAGAADGLATTTACDATGFSRARFVFTFGNGVATTGVIESNIGPWESATSGGVYTSRSAAVIGTNLTSGILSSQCRIVIVDIPISEAKPWLKISGGSNLSTAVPHSCVVELYDAVTYPISASAYRTVTI